MVNTIWLIVLTIGVVLLLVGRLVEMSRFRKAEKVFKSKLKLISKDLIKRCKNVQEYNEQTIGDKLTKEEFERLKNE